MAADALVTLGQLSSREGETEEASRMFTAAFEQAAGTRMLQVELRATYFLALEQQTRGELAEAARIAQLGVRRADDEGLGLAPYGLDLRHLHFQARFLSGEWDEAQQLADGFPVRVTSLPEAVLSAMALFVDVARDNPAAEERRTWLEPFFHDSFVTYIARGLLAEQALWRGDTDLALSHAEAAIRGGHAARATVPRCSARPPSRWRRARTARSPRGWPGTPAPRPLSWKSPGNCSISPAWAPGTQHGPRPCSARKAGAGLPGPRPSTFGHPGRNAPEAWEAVLAAFGPQYVYETARGQWRLAEALIGAGPPRGGGGRMAGGGGNGRATGRGAAVGSA